MKNSILALIKFAKYFPAAKLHYIYIITGIEGLGVAYTIDRKLVKRFKKIKDIKIEKRLICRTLF